MKFLYLSVLLFFMSFLSTPTVISLIDKEVDISYFYTLCEEEERQVCFDELKTLFLMSFVIDVLSYNLPILLNIFSETSLSFTILSHQIFSPPPEII